MKTTTTSPKSNPTTRPERPRPSRSAWPADWVLDGTESMFIGRDDFPSWPRDDRAERRTDPRN